MRELLLLLLEGTVRNFASQSKVFSCFHAPYKRTLSKAHLFQYRCVLYVLVFAVRSILPRRSLNSTRSCSSPCFRLTAPCPSAPPCPPATTAGAGRETERRPPSLGGATGATGRVRGKKAMWGNPFFRLEMVIHLMRKYSRENSKRKTFVVMSLTTFRLL